MIPDKKLCLDVLANESVPDHIRVHSVMVADVALKIAQALNANGESIDLALLEAGALLHDVMKMKSIESGGNHATLGGERVAELGFEELAPLVARHVDLGVWDPAGPVTEAELVNYADKRVRHTEVVTLDERFHDLVERYGKSEKAVERIKEHWLVVSRVEKKIFAILEIPPDSFAL